MCEKKHSIVKVLKKIQISVCISSFLTVLFDIASPTIAFAINSDIEYYGVILMTYIFRICLIVGTLILFFVSFVVLCAVWRKYHSFNKDFLLLQWAVDWRCYGT